jgi:hypothetical protein
LFCRNDEIALVLSIFIIHQDDHAASADIIE